MLVWKLLSGFYASLPLSVPSGPTQSFPNQSQFDSAILPFIIPFSLKPEAIQDPTDISVIELKGLDVETLQYRCGTWVYGYD